jgi:hypothetical protein
LFYSGQDCMPAVTQLSPSQGSTGGGTTVTITGSSLSGATAVYFGDVPATSFQVVSDSVITAVTPSHDRILAVVTVDGPEGRSVANQMAWFSFQSPSVYFDIVAVTWVPSTSSLVISGSGIHEGCAVRINGQLAPKVKMKRMPAGDYQAIVKGGAALKAMLPKRRYVAITLDNPGQPLMTAIALYARGNPN